MFRFLLPIGIAFISQAFADYDPNTWNNVIRDVGSATADQAVTKDALICTGAQCFIDLINKILVQIQPLILIGALFIIVRHGMLLVNSQDEEKLTKAKRMIASALAAIVLSYLAKPFTEAFYGGLGGGGADAGKAYQTPGAETALIGELNAFITWAETIVAVLAVTIIITSAVLAILSFGKEDSSTQVKRSIYAVIAGILIIVSKQVILNVFQLEPGGPGGSIVVDPLITKILAIVNAIIVFAALAAAAVMVYAGILMMLNFGNEDQYTKGKGILIRASIGFFAMLISFAVIKFVIGTVPI